MKYYVVCYDTNAVKYEYRNFLEFAFQHKYIDKLIDRSSQMLSKVTFEKDELQFITRMGRDRMHLDEHHTDHYRLLDPVTFKAACQYFVNDSENQS